MVLSGFIQEPAPFQETAGFWTLNKNVRVKINMTRLETWTDYYIERKRYPLPEKVPLIDAQINHLKVISYNVIKIIVG